MDSSSLRIPGDPNGILLWKQYGILQVYMIEQESTVSNGWQPLRNQFSCTVCYSALSTCDTIYNKCRKCRTICSWLTDRNCPLWFINELSMRTPTDLNGNLLPKNRHLFTNAGSVSFIFRYSSFPFCPKTSSLELAMEYFRLPDILSPQMTWFSTHK